MVFINSYLYCRDIKQACRDALINTLTGKALLNRKDIHKTICKITELSCFKYGIDPQELITKIKDIVDIDPIDIFNPDGTCKQNMNDIAPEIRRGIKKFKCKNLFGLDVNGISTVIGHLIEVEFYDKLKSTQMLGVEAGMFKETHKVEHDVTSNMKELLLAAGKRAEDAVIKERREKEIDITPIPNRPTKRPFPQPFSGVTSKPSKSIA